MTPFQPTSPSAVCAVLAQWVRTSDWLLAVMIPTVPDPSLAAYEEPPAGAVADPPAMVLSLPPHAATDSGTTTAATSAASCLTRPSSGREPDAPGPRWTGRASR